MRKRTILKAIRAAPLAPAAGRAAAQAVPFKFGLLAPMTGPFALTGQHMHAGARIYMAQSGATVAGRMVELILKDDTGTPGVTKRLAQELVVNETSAFRKTTLPHRNTTHAIN